METEKQAIENDDRFEVIQVEVKRCKACEAQIGIDWKECPACVSKLCRECGADLGASWRYICGKCHGEKQAARFNSREEVDWDGVTPLVEFCSDRFYFEAEKIEVRLKDGVTLESLQLVLCEEREPPVFEMYNFLTSVLPDSYDPSQLENTEVEPIEKAVNDYIQKHRPWFWVEGDKRVSLKSVREFVSEPKKED